MNRYEEELWLKEVLNRIFFTSKENKGPIYTERATKRRKKEYEQLVIRLNLLKDLKQKEAPKRDSNQKFIKPIYTDEDKEFLQKALDNKELTLADLTADEYFLLKIPYEQLLRIERSIFCKIKLTKKGYEEFCKNINLLRDSITPRLIVQIYKDANEKYPPQQKKK